MKAIIILVAMVLGVQQMQGQWSEMGGPEGGSISSIVELQGVLVAGSSGGGVFRSTDRGAHWSPATTEPARMMDVQSLAVRSSDLLASTAHGVYRSVDLGVTWEFSGSGLPADTVALSLETSDPEDILCGLFRGGLYHSTDGGRLWLPLNWASEYARYEYLDLMRSDSGILAATNYGMKLSRDSGRTWNSVIPALRGYGYYAYRLTRTGDTIYAGTSVGLWKSGNEGVTWVQIPTNVFGIVDIRGVAVWGDTIVVGSTGGCHYSSRRGIGWSEINTGLQSSYIRDLLHLSDGLYAATWAGIFRTPSRGPWVEIDGGLNATKIEALAVAGATLHAGMPYMRTTRSTDSGATWIVAPGSAGSVWNSTFHSFLAFGDTVYGGIYAVGLGGANWSGINRTTDNGVTWTEHDLDLPSNNRPVELAGTRGLMYGNFREPSYWSKIYRSTDNGSHWVRADSGLPVNERSGLFDAGEGRLFISALKGGIYRSTDSSAHWKKRSVGLPDSATSQAITAYRGILLAGIDGYGVYRSGDFGESWQQSAAGLPAGTTIEAFAIYQNVILAGGNTGLFRSADGGLTWERWDTGLPRGVTISRLALLGDELFAGTDGRGVWRASLAGTVDVREGNDWTPLELDLW